MESLFDQASQVGFEHGVEIGLEQGMQEGIAQGIERGMQEGIAQGIERGARAEKAQTVRRLLGMGLSASQVALAVGIEEKDLGSYVSDGA